MNKEQNLKKNQIELRTTNKFKLIAYCPILILIPTVTIRIMHDPVTIFYRLENIFKYYARCLQRIVFFIVFSDFQKSAIKINSRTNADTVIRCYCVYESKRKIPNTGFVTSNIFIDKFTFVVVQIRI